MTIVRSTDYRRTETPSSVATTYASPTQGGSERAALWRVEVPAGRSGPAHVFDVEQIWTFLDGDARLELDGETITLRTGDTVVLPPGVLRRFTAGSGGYTALATAPAGASAWQPGGDAEKIVPAWIA